MPAFNSDDNTDSAGTYGGFSFFNTYFFSPLFVCSLNFFLLRLAVSFYRLKLKDKGEKRTNNARKYFSLPKVNIPPIAIHGGFSECLFFIVLMWPNIYSRANVLIFVFNLKRRKMPTRVYFLCWPRWINLNWNWNWKNFRRSFSGPEGKENWVELSIYTHNIYYYLWLVDVLIFKRCEYSCMY